MWFYNDVPRGRNWQRLEVRIDLLEQVSAAQRRYYAALTTPRPKPMFKTLGPVSALR